MPPATRYEWSRLERLFSDTVAENLSRWLDTRAAHYSMTMTFALGRLGEGRQVAEFFLNRGRTGRVLDIGAGNGGASLGFANFPDFAVTALDVIPNTDLLQLRRASNLPIAQIVGSGHTLPFADSAFDIVLCLDTIEHVPRPDLLGAEIARVLRSGGICMMTTPPRLRYWFRRDPHYGIPGLLLLPDRLQRVVGRRLLSVPDLYDVTHIFWHVREIARLFNGTEVEEVLWNYPYRGRGWRDRLWYRFRHFLWDRILLRKL